MSKDQSYIRQPIIAVLGHVDHGKTSILDIIRKTSVHQKEYGAITQHIGASEVPAHIITTMCKDQIKYFNLNIKVPGILFIDTPGHEAFTHLRERGSNIADFAVLVIDISQGVQEQTIESIQILREYKTPFLIACNKIDLLPGWLKEKNISSFLEALTIQNDSVLTELDKRIYNIISKLSEFGFSSDRFDRVKDFTKEIAIVPVSAKTGVGISELLVLIIAICQKFLGKRLTIDPNAPAKGTILEVVDVKGLGKTMNVLLYDGQLNKNDIIIFPSQKGIIKTKVKSLLKPQPLTEIRQIKNTSFVYVDSVVASAGVKVIANDVEHAIPGAPVVELTGTNVAFDNQITSNIMKDINMLFINKPSGIVVKADTLGSLQALLKILATKNIEVSSSGIGPITNEDVAKAASMGSKNLDFAVILAFHIDVPNEVIQQALKKGVVIINSMIIYEVVDKYLDYVLRKKEAQKNVFLSQINLPCKLLVLRNCCFRNKKPCIFGVRVIEGELRTKDELMTGTGVYIGQIKSIQKDKESIERSVPSDEVAISIDEAEFGANVLPDEYLYSYFDRNLFLKAVENFDYFTNSQKTVLTEIASILGLSHFLKK